MNDAVLESRLDYALRYAALGWWVLPLHWITVKRLCSCGKACKSPGKHPLTKTGLKEASYDPDKIRRWLDQWPNANIGIVTGAISGILALDIDPRHGGDDSLDTIRSELGAIPDDVLAITGSGGKHYLFQYPGIVGRSTTNLWPGIDSRGDGGYIVVAPSTHASGQAYFWDAEADPLNGANLPPCPDWLTAKLAKNLKPALDKPTDTIVLPPNEVKKIRAALGYIRADDREQWLQVGMALHASGADQQAFGLWCEWSQQSDKFDFKDQRRVWESFRPDGGVTLAGLFGTANENGWQAGKQDKLNLHKQATYYKDDVADEIFTRYVFMAATNRFLDVVTNEEIARDALDGRYWHKHPDLKPSNFLLKSQKCRKADTFTYQPGVTDNPIREGDAIRWNRWNPPQLNLPDKVDKWDVEPWLELLTRHVPNHENRHHLLCWMAHVLQCPLVKINHAPLLVGEVQGNGKDSLLEPLRYGLGYQNVAEPSAEMLVDKFSDIFVDKKLIIVQEVLYTEQGMNAAQIENRLKPYLAAPPDYLEINRKGVRGIRIPNIVQLFLMSNHHKALHISAHDRRFFCVLSDGCAKAS